MGAKVGGASDARYLQSPLLKWGEMARHSIMLHRLKHSQTPRAANPGKRESVSQRARQTAGQLFGPKSKNVDVIYKCFKCIKDPLANLLTLRMAARLCNNAPTASDGNVLYLQAFKDTQGLLTSSKTVQNPKQQSPETVDRQSGYFKLTLGVNVSADGCFVFVVWPFDDVDARPRWTPPLARRQAGMCSNPCFHEGKKRRVLFLFLNEPY